MKVSIGPYKEDNTARREEVVIHDYDTWSMDHTLALIALPMLKQLKETKHGVPYMDYEDMPGHLQFIRREYDTRAIGDLFSEPGEYFNEEEFDRQVEIWNWMMDEMIWAMEQVIEDDVVYIGDIEHNDRVDNGLKLFGKYYRSLWD